MIKATLRVADNQRTSEQQSTVFVVQSESSDGLIDGAIWGIGENVTNWCVPGDFRGEFILLLYRMVYILLRIKV